MAKVLFVACAAAAVGAVSALQFDLPASNTKVSRASAVLPLRALTPFPRTTCRSASRR